MAPNHHQQTKRPKCSRDHSAATRPKTMPQATPSDRTLEELPEFLLVLQYLDATSLARLGATNRHNRHFVQFEVASRKKAIALYEQRIEQVLGGCADDNCDYDDDYVRWKKTQQHFTRENVQMAMQWKQQAYALVQSDPAMDASTISNSNCQQHIFYTELRKFDPQPGADGTFPRYSPLALPLLPLCFYPCGNCQAFDDKHDADDREECFEMMKADCRRLWRLVDAADFPQRQASFVASFHQSPELLDTFRAAARCWVSSHLAASGGDALLALSTMQTTITMIEMELRSREPSVDRI